MNDHEFQRLTRFFAADPELAAGALDLVPAAEREASGTARLDDARLAAICARVQRRLHPWRAALAFLEQAGLQVVHATGAWLGRVAVMPAERAARFVRDAIDACDVEPAVATFGAATAGFVPVVIGARDESPVRVPLAATPRWLSQGGLRLVLRMPRYLEEQHPGLREAAAVLHFGHGGSVCTTEAALVKFTVVGTDERYLIDLPFPRAFGDEEISPDLVRRLRLFPMTA